MVCKLHLLLLFAVVVLAVAMHPPREDRKAFEQFKKDFSKVYQNKAEDEKRFKNFVVNMAQARKLNAEYKGTATFGVTMFSDLSFEEYKNTHGRPLGR